MLVVPGLNIRLAGILLHAGRIHQDIADTELFRRHKTGFMLLIILTDFIVGDGLLRRQRVDVQRRLTNVTLL